ncbi:hypothetical protein HDU81_008018 [Chytriomyces hyalinus]|nr:hypothetical protein HDU81_008018 [Chytriomyces hyalinus]
MSKPGTSVTPPSDSATTMPVVKAPSAHVSLPSPESIRKQVHPNPPKTKSTFSDSESDTTPVTLTAPKRKHSNARLCETVVLESPQSQPQNKGSVRVNTPPATLKRAFDGFDSSDESEVGELDGRLRRRRRLASYASTPQTKTRSKRALPKQLDVETVQESPAPIGAPQSPDRSNNHAAAGVASTPPTKQKSDLASTKLEIPPASTEQLGIATMQESRPQSPDRSNNHAAAVVASTPPRKQKSDLGSSKLEIPPASPKFKLADQSAAAAVKNTRSRVKITPISDTGLDPFDSDNEQPASKPARLPPSKKRSASSEDPFDSSGPPPPAPRKKRGFFKSLDEISRKVEPTSPVRKGDKGKRGSVADFWGV